MITFRHNLKLVPQVVALMKETSQSEESEKVGQISRGLAGVCLFLEKFEFD
jgi:hypothetical protein